MRFSEKEGQLRKQIMKRFLISVVRLSLLIIGFCFLSMSSSGMDAAPDAPRYNIIDLGVRVPQGCQGASAINDQGQIIGWGHSPDAVSLNDHSQIVGGGQPSNAGFYMDYSTGKPLKQYVNGHVYFWQNGRRQNLGSFAVCGLNNQGQIIGFPFDIDGSTQPFVWERGTLHHLPNLPGGVGETAEGISDSGQVVGKENCANRSLHAFLWQNGHMTDLGDFAGIHSTLLGTCLNNKGQVVAETYTYTDEEHQSASGLRRAFLWQDGKTTEISALVGPDATVSKISDSADMIGVLHTSSKIQHAGYWSQGKRHDLGTLGGLWSLAYGLNNAGQVVGAAAMPGGKGHAFLSEHGRMLDLNRLIPSHSGWVLGGATGINNKGQIIGDGLYHGHNCSFLLTPR